MTAEKAFDGKPYAGSPHVRFDEGRVASVAKPKRRALLEVAMAFSRCIYETGGRIFPLLIVAGMSAMLGAATVSVQSSGSITLDTSAYEMSVCLSGNEVLPLDTTQPGMMMIIR